MVQFPQTKGIIFDLDGTLVTSEIDFAELSRALGIDRGTDILLHIEQLECETDRTDALALVEGHELRDAELSHWLPGASEMLTELHDMQIPMAIVTRNFPAAAQIKIARNNIPIKLLITRADAKPKPHPEALLAISSQWCIPPQELLYVGDYLYDLQAAANAGMRSCLYAPCALPHFAHQADLICNDYSNFLRLVGIK